MSEFTIIPIKPSHARIRGLGKTVCFDLRLLARQIGLFRRLGLAAKASHPTRLLRPLCLGDSRLFQKVELA